jgi:hypothetical protein
VSVSPISDPSLLIIVHPVIDELDRIGIFESRNTLLQTHLMVLAVQSILVRIPSVFHGANGVAKP